MTEKELIQAWRTNNKINLMLVEKIKPDGWEVTLSKRGGRGVAGEFAHIHNVRVDHLKRRAKDIADPFERFPTKHVPTKKEITTALKASSTAIEKLLTGVFNGEPKRKGFKRGLFTTLSYFIAHEAHHRGRILLTLKVAGQTIDKTTAYAIWDWDRI